MRKNNKDAKSFTIPSRGRGGEPKKYTKEYLDDLAIKLEQYVDATPIPFLKEFCYQNRLRSDTISKDCYGRSEKFDETVMYLKDKQEVNLVKSALGNKTNPAMAIFTLKNVAGWRDQKNEERKDERLEDFLEFASTMKRAAETAKLDRFYN